MIMSYSSITILMIPLFALLLIPGLDSMSVAFAQYDIPDIPNMDDFEIPSQEEIEKMMEQQEVSGKYTNPEFGVEVMIPSGWSGMASDFKDPTTGEWISGFQTMEGGINANMGSMQRGEFEIIALSIIDKSEKNSTDPPEVRPPGEDYDVDCDVIKMKKISVNGKDVMELEAQCKGEISMKTKMYHYATNEKIISYAYMTSPASEYNNNINKFEDSVKTLKIANQVSVSYETPDDITIEETISDTTEAIENLAEDTTEAAEELAEDTTEATEDLTSDITTEIEDATTDGEGGGCLIATAAYGTELAPQVQFLREIRDNTVMSTSSGAAFMTGFNQLYYSFSPTIADLERENPIFQETVRLFITPMMSSLSIMTLAEDGNESQVLALGISVIALNLGMYFVAPTVVGFTISRRLKSKNQLG